jgi:hypothetical protein
VAEGSAGALIRAVFKDLLGPAENLSVKFYGEVSCGLSWSRWEKKAILLVQVSSGCYVCDPVTWNRRTTKVSTAPQQHAYKNQVHEIETRGLLQLLDVLATL